MMFFKSGFVLNYDFKNFFNKPYEISNSFIDISNDFKKTVKNYEIIHTIINKYIIDGKIYLRCQIMKSMIILF